MTGVRREAPQTRKSVKCLDLPGIPGVLRMLRLRQLAALDANCPLSLKAFLQAVDAKPLAWTVSVAENLRQMHSRDPKLRQLPDPDEGLLAWRAVWQEFPSRLEDTHSEGRKRRVACGGVGRAPARPLPRVRSRLSVHARAPGAFEPQAWSTHPRAQVRGIVTVSHLPQGLQDALARHPARSREQHCMSGTHYSRVRCLHRLPK